MMMKHLKSLIAPALVAVFAVTAAQAAFYQWSKTASNNAGADPTINWAEGMSPSAVNDSARAQMARTAEWRDDISGALTTTGTGTALVLATNQGFTTTALMDNAMIAFVPNVTNTGAVTLAVDGLTAKPIRSQTGTAGNLGAGVLILGTPYVVTYKDTAGEFLLQGFVGNPYAVPLGSFMFHSVAVVPNSNFIMPIGQELNRTIYAAYFAMVGTTFGVGNGTTTFNAPDLRSRIPVALATMGGADPGRITTAGSGVDGATIGAVGGTQNVTLPRNSLPNVSLDVEIPVGQGSHTHALTNGNSVLQNTGPGTVQSGATAAAASVTVSAQAATLPLMTGFTSYLSGGVSSQVATSKMPPVMVLPLILRIL